MAFFIFRYSVEEEPTKASTNFAKYPQYFKVRNSGPVPSVRSSLQALLFGGKFAFNENAASGLPRSIKLHNVCNLSLRFH